MDAATEQVVTPLVDVALVAEVEVARLPPVPMPPPMPRLPPLPVLLLTPVLPPFALPLLVVNGELPPLPELVAGEDPPTDEALPVELLVVGPLLVTDAAPATPLDVAFEAPMPVVVPLVVASEESKDDPCAQLTAITLIPKNKSKARRMVLISSQETGS